MNTATAYDGTHLQRALELAERGLYTTDPNPRVGCVIADQERVLGEGWHMRAGEPHAEVLALREAGPLARGASAYVTLEPCSHTGRTPPCADALIAAGVRRVVCCTADPNPKVAGGGLERLRAAGIEVSTGMFAQPARALNPGFFSRFERHRPYVRLKLAMTLDGRTAPAAGGRVWISSEASRADVQTWRARSSVVLTGSGTVRTDDPRLDVRLNYGPWVRQPLRVVLDTELACPPEAKMFRDGHALAFAAADAPGGSPPPDGGAPPGIEPYSASINVERVPRAPGGLDLGAVLARLAALEANEVLLECGARLAGAFVSKGLVDEIVLYVAPSLMGELAAPLVYLGIDAAQAGEAQAGMAQAGMAQAGMAQAGMAQGKAPPAGAAPPPLSKFEFNDARRIGDDVRLVLTLREH
jgi:diaminohydroxyphosphoribosylaminopyrimidine deaminase/5-amino-6-(5-phosphoribosylamino)uracil reductase